MTRPLSANDGAAWRRLCAAALLALPIACSWAQPAPAAPGDAARQAEAKQNAARIAARAASALEAARPDPWTIQEQTFLQAARAASVLAVEAGRIGMRRGTDPAVRKLAQRLAAEHGAAVLELDGMAQSRGLQLDTGATAAQQQSLQQLQASGGNFDTVFVRDVGVRAQQAAIALFERAPGRTRDAELRSWIATKLQRMGELLTAAQQIPLRHAPDRTPNSGRNDAPAQAQPGGVRP